ncbi:hypothetical protein [Archangium sp.]|uniref:hypothetical protein n=1 Tax=Archangium sp. TaxID=1872627 RepID=UPI00389A588D
MVSLFMVSFAVGLLSSGGTGRPQCVSGNGVCVEHCDGVDTDCLTPAMNQSFPSDDLESSSGLPLCVNGNGECDEDCDGVDTDCISLPSVDNPLPGEKISTPCGGSIFVRTKEGALGKAGTGVRARFSNARAALDSKEPKFFDAHTTGVAHAELEGFGVTLIQRDGGFLTPQPLENASGDLDDPNLLFFQKKPGPESGWPIIGMGYSFTFKPCDAPELDSISSVHFWVHEAGWHHAPGDGNFECATTSDLKQSALDEGKRLDGAGCVAIEKSDLREHEFDAEHERIWTVHVWFEPGTGRPAVKRTDPWCRQSTSALRVECANGVDDAFFKQGDCSSVCD